MFSSETISTFLIRAVFIRIVKTTFTYHHKLCKKKPAWVDETLFTRTKSIFIRFFFSFTFRSMAMESSIYVLPLGATHFVFIYGRHVKCRTKIIFRWKPTDFILQNLVEFIHLRRNTHFILFLVIYGKMYIFYEQFLFNQFVDLFADFERMQMKREEKEKKKKMLFMLWFFFKIEDNFYAASHLVKEMNILKYSLCGLVFSIIRNNVVYIVSYHVIF